MMAWEPPHTQADFVRYESMAKDIGEVVSDPAEKPVFAGDDGRMRTALLLASTALDESHFRADIDDGRVRGDHGRSVCIMQVWVDKGRTHEGWNADDLLGDRTKCIRAALHIMHGSIAWCRALSGGDLLGGYTHGQCVKPNPIGRVRWKRALNWPLTHLVEVAATDDAGGAGQ